MAAATASINVVLACALGVGQAPATDGGPRRLPTVDLGEPQELALPLSPGVVAAMRLADGGRYDQAAAALVALASEQGDLRLLYHAGVMRTRAGQNAAAAREFQRYLDRAGGASSAARQYVEQRMIAARGQLVGVRIAAVEGGQAVPADVLARATVRLEPVGSADPTAVIVLSGYSGEEVLVDRAPVVVHLAIPGYLPVSQLRNPGAGETAWSLVVARQKIQVELRFSPEKAARGSTLRLSPVDGANAPTIERPIDAPTWTAPLTTGRWQIDVMAKRYEAQRVIDVAPGMRAVDVALDRKSRGGGGGGGRGRGGDEFTDMDGMSAVFGGAFVVAAMTGLGLTIAGLTKEAKARRRNDDATMDALLATADGDGGMSALARVEEAYPTARLHRDIDRSFNLTTAGGVVALASLGAALAGVTIQGRVKRNAAYLEMGVGALLAGGGAGWMVYAMGRQDDLLAPTDPESRRSWSDLRSGAGHRAGATVLLGLGAGLVVFPAIALIADSVNRRRMQRRGLAVAPALGRDRVGVTIQGGF